MASSGGSTMGTQTGEGYFSGGAGVPIYQFGSMPNNGAGLSSMFTNTSPQGNFGGFGGQFNPSPAAGSPTYSQPFQSAYDPAGTPSPSSPGYQNQPIPMAANNPMAYGPSQTINTMQQGYPGPMAVPNLASYMNGSPYAGAGMWTPGINPSTLNQPINQAPATSQPNVWNNAGQGTQGIGTTAPQAPSIPQALLNLLMNGPGQGAAMGQGGPGMMGGAPTGPMGSSGQYAGGHTGAAQWWNPAGRAWGT